MIDKKILIEKNNELSEYLSQLLGKELNDFLSADIKDRAIRINQLKTEPGSLQNTIGKETLKELPYSPDGYKIKNQISSLSQTLDFFTGSFAFQGASSQIPAIVLDPKPGQKVLDMTASPGSKTTQMGVMMQNKGELIVNDSNLNRMQALNTNTQKTGLINHIIYYLAGERFGRLFPEYFDKVLLDTPCTGLGTLATNKEVLSWWSYKKLAKLAKIQKQLLISAIKSTKVGGEIVYSTCSVAPEENEVVINDVLKNYPLELLPIDNHGMENFNDGFTVYKKTSLHDSLKNTKRIWPHRHSMEGFFVARIKKTAEYYNKNNPKEVNYFKTLLFSDSAIINDLKSISQSWGIDENLWESYRFIKTRDRIWILNDEIENIVKEGFTNAGMLLAEQRLNIWKLSHQSVQFFSEKISKRRITLPFQKINELFLNGICDSPIKENGYYALTIDNKPLAMIYIEKEQIKIKLPHPFNFQYTK